jgi:hypothetical protein
MTTRIATAAGAGPDTRFFVPFTKAEEQTNGNVYVEGIATGEVLDYHGEVVSYEASKAAFKEWSAWAEKVTDGESIGNIRVMHQPVVAGRAVKWWADDETRSIHLGCTIEDPTAAKLCRSRAYTGFSIGGDNVKREMGLWEGKSVPWIQGYRLAENSIVDKGACPTATFTLVKRADHKESPMTLHELFKANRLAVLAVAAKMSDQKTITIGDLTISTDVLEKDAAGAGAAAMSALKAFMQETLGGSAEADLWTLGDILEAMRYCYSACLGVQYAMADAAMDTSGMEMAATATLKKSDTPDDPPKEDEEKPVVEEEIDPPKAPEPAPAVPPAEPEPEKQAAVDLGPVLDAIAKLSAIVSPLVSVVKALTKDGLEKSAVTLDLTKLEADVATIKKAIESFPAPPAGRPVAKSIGHEVANPQRISTDDLSKSVEALEAAGMLDPVQRQQVRLQLAARSLAR